jgi:predicted lipoprotein with Yx(FWY)xxD motif
LVYETNQTGEFTMSYRRTALFGGAAAVTSFMGIGVGTAADAAPTHTSPVHGASPAATMKTLIRLQGVAKPATLHAARGTVNGKTETILVTAKGLPLYYYRADTAKTSFVAGELARLWPPLISAKPTATGTQGKLTALKVASGHQVTYNGHFLYTFVSDSPGHVTGEGVSDFSVVTPHIKSIGSTSKVAVPPHSSGGGYSY